MAQNYTLSNWDKSFNIDRDKLEKALKNDKDWKLSKALSQLNITNDNWSTITYNRAGTRTVDTSTKIKPTTTQDVIDENKQKAVDAISKAKEARDKMAMIDPSALQAASEWRASDYWETTQAQVDNYEWNRDDYNQAMEDYNQAYTAMANAQVEQDETYNKINDEVQDSQLDEVMAWLNEINEADNPYDSILNELNSESAADTAPTGSSVIDYEDEATYAANNSDSSDDDDDEDYDWNWYWYGDYAPQYTDKSALDETYDNVWDTINDYEIVNPFEIKKETGPLSSRWGYDLTRITRK